MKFDILIKQTGRKFKELGNGEYEFYGDCEDQGFILGDVDICNIQKSLEMLLSDAQTLNYKIQNIVISDSKTIDRISKIIKN